MPLNGFSLRCGKLSGGISEIAIACADAVESVEFDADGTATAIRMVGGQYFARYGVRECEAEYSESVARVDGARVVRHRLAFGLERLDADSRRAVDELTAADPQGMVAVVVTNNGVKYLVGISRKFGRERPLRLDTAAATSGVRHSDAAGETVVMISEDTCKAAVFTGGIAFAP